jgi:uncharacterized lipoprotein YajG
MKRIFAILSLILLTSCATLRTFAEELRTNPAAAIQQPGSTFDTALNLARAGFEIWAAANPDAAPQARVQFNSIVSEVGRGVRVGQSVVGVVTAENADQRFDAARTGMQNLNAFLAGLNGQPGSASGPEMQEAVAATAEAARYHVAR